MKTHAGINLGCHIALFLFATTAPVLSEDLFTNGDFETGTNGFSTEYTFAPAGNSTEGEFTVRSDPQNWNLEFAPTPDHTSGTGMVLVVNGATSGAKAVWEQTVVVTPFTTYQFQAWVCTAVAGGPADLTVEINGLAVGSSTMAPAEAGIWLPFGRSWNSGMASQATVRIIDTDVSRFPNDFYLDDLSFGVEPSAPYLQIGMQSGIPHIEIYSRIGKTNRVEFASKLFTAADWTPLTNVWCNSSPFSVLDPSASNSVRRFYRAVEVP